MVMLMVMVRVMAMEMATMLVFKHIMAIRSTSTQKVSPSNHGNAPRVQVLDTVLRYCLHVQKVAAMMVQWCVGWEPLVLDLRTIRIHQTTMLPI